MRKFLAWALLLPTVAAVMVACGGAGSSSNGPTAAIQGVAATGAPLSLAPIYIKDAAGHEPTGQSEADGISVVSTDANGAFNLSPALLSGLQSPLLLKVVGKTVLDNGDDAVTVLHSVVKFSDSQINITPLTEVASTMILGADPSYTFRNTGSTLSGLSSSAREDASARIMTTLALSDSQLTDLNVFSSSLDPEVSTATTVSDAKRHDQLLDSLALTKVGTEVRLIDRNGPADDYASQPQLKLTVGESLPSTVNGSPTGPQLGLNSQLLDDFITRLNTKLAAGCTLGDVTDCSGVTADASIFAATYKHQGMPADIWMKKWVGTALDIEDFSSVNVSLKAPVVGAWTISGQYVVRVLLKWQQGGGDFVYRSMLLTEQNGRVVAYGNQKDYFVWIKPRLVSYTDADGTLPHYPRYELGLSLNAGHWYAGQKNAVLGAQFEGPGLPTNRNTSSVNNSSGELSNPNLIANGVEVFDLRTKWGCQHLSLDPSVYTSVNTDYWSRAWANQTMYNGSMRWKDGSTTCAPAFDFLRYFGVTVDSGRTYNMPSNFAYPKRGDNYTVTLYLNPAKFGGAGQPSLPSGTTQTTKRFPDGTTKTVWKYQVTYTLQADAFQWQNGGYSVSYFPGVTDQSRANLLTFNEGVDKSVAWARNRVLWPDGVDANGSPVYGTFVNFTAGFFSSSYDQMSGTDSNQTTSGNLNSHGVEMGRKNYRELFGDGQFSSVYPTNPALTRPYYCGSANSVLHRGAPVIVYAQKCTGNSSTCNNDAANSANWITQTSCPAVADVTHTNSGIYSYVADSTVFYRYYAGRSRVKASLDRFTFLAANQTSRTFRWSDLASKESEGAIGLCSSQKGFWAYRGVNVQLIDINGRSLMEQRQIWSDFPGKAATLAGDSTNVNSPAWVRTRDVSRPNLDTDPLYVSFEFTPEELQPFGLTAPYLGQKGYIVPFKKMQNGQCVDFDWQPNQ